MMKFQVKKFRELNGFSRFLRLKWLILLIAFPAFVIWLFWPVPTYDGYAPTYIAVDNGKDFLGVVTVTKFANPWEAAAFVSDETSPAFRELLLKDSGIKCVWSTKKGTSLPGDLYFRRENLVWKIAPADAIRDGKRGDKVWMDAIESLAGQTDRIFTTGTLQSSQIEVKKLTRFQVFFTNPWNDFTDRLRKIF